jgi:Flp pilus assembly protein TadG
MSTLVASSRQTKSGSLSSTQAQFGVLGALKSGLRKFKDDRSGDIAITFGLTCVIMFVLVGGAVDYGRWLHASKQTKTAIDAAVLAGGRVLQVQGTSATAVQNAQAAAVKFYKENTKTRLAVVSDTVTFNMTPTNDGFTASGNAYIATPIFSVLSILDSKPHEQLPLIGKSTTEYSVAKLKVGGNAENSLEIAMMLDTSGSMAGTKIADMKLAAKDLINIVVWDNQSTYTSKVSIAPFSADVRLPSSMNAGARGNPVPSKTLVGTCTTGSGKNKVTGPCNVVYNLTSCVVERAGTNKYTDVAPGSGNYVMAEYTTNGSCSQPSSNAVVPLSNNKTTLNAAIDGLALGGGTAGHLGTAWAWYTISPNWGPLFPGASQPAAYNAPKLQKIAILMTDGEYNTQYSVNGVLSTANGAGALANGSSVDQAKALCTAMKAKGITVYTVGFDLGGNQTAIDTLGFCATSPSTFYQASSGSDLRQAFRDIALKISDLYLSQ